MPLLGTWTPPPYSRAPSSMDRGSSLALHRLTVSIRNALEAEAARRPLDGCVLMLPSGLTLKLRAPSHYARVPSPRT